MLLQSLYCFGEVIYFLSHLGDLIKSRKDNILKSLQDADNKFREAEENLAFSKKNFELAKSKAEQIRSQGLIVSAQTVKTLLDSIDDDIKRLKASNIAMIHFEEEKSVNEVV
jgi:F0F1-type ATP synthase membrane subunit b/b'